MLISYFKNLGNRKCGFLSLCCLFLLSMCSDKQTAQIIEKPIVVGAARFDQYLPQLKNKSLGLLINQSSRVENTLLVDTLVALGSNITKIFTPEHGFAGTYDAGEYVENEHYYKAIPLVSLYGKNKQPSQVQLADIDILIFDIQDVGVRFYTYSSTMYLAMAAVAQAGKKFIVLDRPNPNGHYVAGPVLDTACCRSFVGMLPIPLVYGLTSGELAQMINGENWLPNGLKCELEVIPCTNYRHNRSYSLPVRPSPNLPNDLSIALYPSLALFEGTIISVGRGTAFPFQVIGTPDYPDTTFSFRPQSKAAAKYPKFLNKKCFGQDLRGLKPSQIKFNLDFLLEFYQKSTAKTTFFNPYFNKLAGNLELQKQLEAGLSQAIIYQSWASDLETYKVKRQAYLLYP